MSAAALERRASLAVIAAGLLVWTALLVWLPARFQGFDEAKYLGIGLNLQAGLGPITVFGDFFEPHAPLWPLVMALPQAWFGADAYGWAHGLGIAASTTVMGLAAALGWRIRPAAGALAVGAIVAFPYLFELSRRVGLDMPTAALTLGYLVVGGIAVRRGSAGWGLAAGAMFAAAFLVKESVLPLAPVPFLAAIAATRPAAQTARVAAWTLLAAVVGTSWWWWMYAAETGRVYRLGTPAWTLAPLLVAVVIVVALGLAWRRIRMPAAPRFLTGARLAWGLALVWVAAQAVFFSRTPELRDFGLVSPAQLGFYADEWLDALRPLIAIGGIGAVLELGSRVVGRRPGPPGTPADERPPGPPTAARPPGRPTDEIWLALVCSVPFILLVIGVGELPRHYVAQMVLLIVIGAAGWLALLDVVVRRPTTVHLTALVVAATAAAVLMAPLVAGRRTLVVALAVMGVAVVAGAAVVGARAATRAAAMRRLRAGGAVALVVVLAFTGAIGALVVSAAGLRDGSPLDIAKASAAASVADWIRTELPPGSTVAFGASLAYEIAVDLGPEYDVVQIREARDVVFDPDAPLGIVRQRSAPADDWIALSASSRNARTWSGYRSAPLIDELRASGTDAWVHVEADDFGEPIVVDAALTPEHGFETAASWTWPTANGRLRATIYRVDPARLGFDETIWMSGLALCRLVDQLEADGGAGARRAATALVERVRLHPDASAGAGLFDRLRRFALPKR